MLGINENKIYILKATISIGAAGQVKNLATFTLIARKNLSCQNKDEELNYMRFDDEIVRAVKRQAALDDTQSKETDDEINEIIQAVRSAVSFGTYDFAVSNSQVLTQSGGKKRYIKQYADCYSAESVLCQCIKQILDRTFRIRYPNRNKSVHSVFDTLKAVKQMSDFRIIKCDFKDYFNSVSAQYVFEKYIKVKLSNIFEADLIDKFMRQTKFAYAGFSTSNVIAEIIAE